LARGTLSVSEERDGYENNECFGKCSFLGDSEESGTTP